MKAGDITRFQGVYQIIWQYVTYTPPTENQIREFFPSTRISDLSHVLPQLTKGDLEASVPHHSRLVPLYLCDQPRRRTESLNEMLERTNSETKQQFRPALFCELFSVALPLLARFPALMLAECGSMATSEGDVQRYVCADDAPLFGGRRFFLRDANAVGCGGVTLLLVPKELDTY